MDRATERLVEAEKALATLQGTCRPDAAVPY